MMTTVRFLKSMFTFVGIAVLAINTATASEHVTTGTSISGVMLAESDCPECDMPMRQHGQMKGQEMKNQHDMHGQKERDKGNMNGSKSGMEHPMGMPPSNSMPSKATPDSSPTTDTAPDPTTENEITN